MDIFQSPQFDNRIHDLLTRFHVPGAAFAIVQNDTTASKGFGWASLGSNFDRPVTADTLFDMASVSKSLTAASVALLIDDDEKYPQLQWESTMSSLLPDDFVMAGSGYTDNVTVEDILSHRSGFPRHDFSLMGERSSTPDTPKSVTRNLRNLEVAAPIRTKFLYSNIMFTVASYLVEVLSGISFVEFLHEHFFSVLGMTSSYLQPNAAIDAGLKDRIATPYTWDAGMKRFKEIQLIQSPEGQGAGSIFTSVNDYIKWTKALMNQERPISTSIYHSLTKPRIIENSEDYDVRNPSTSPLMYAAGLEVLYYSGYEIILHSGGVSGFSSLHLFAPQVKFGAIAVGNSGDAGYVVTIALFELVSELLDIPEAKRPQWDGVVPDDGDVDEAEYEELLHSLCPGLKKAESQNRALSEYTGYYFNIGYHGITVQVRHEKLFINAIDRAEGFTLAFQHACNQTKYIATMLDYYDGDAGLTAVEFEFEHGQAVKMGIKLEDEIEGYIWFERVDTPALRDQTQGWIPER